jgi:hypothetical protein
MKKIVLVSIIIILTVNCIAQVDSMYFGQTPPGDIAIVFAPGIISLPDRLEAKITFSPDSTKCYFEVVNLVKVAGIVTSVNYKIYYTKRNHSVWTKQVEAPFSVNNNVGAPYFSADGKKLYFIKYNSDQTSSDIWTVKDSVGGWSYPQLLPEPINSASMELSYSETTDSLIYISSKRPGGYGGFDIWCKRPSSGQAENLGSIVNTSSYETGSCIAPDGSYLIFASDRFGQEGMAQLYIGFDKGNGEWTAPINMNSGGSKVNERYVNHMDPSLSPDGKYLFFARHSVDTIMDLYWVSTHVLVGLKKYAFTPRLNKQIPNMNVKTDSVINYVIPENTFFCEYGTDKLKYTATLNNGSALPTWLKFDPATKTLSGTPKQVKIDSIKITVSYADTASASCIFRIDVASNVGMSHLKEKKIEIHPNPTTGLINISFGNTVKNAKIEIHNLQGTLLCSSNIINTPVATIYLTGHPKGIYLLKLTADSEIFIQKINLK